jgi:hypothetical protein
MLRNHVASVIGKRESRHHGRIICHSTIKNDSGAILNSVSLSKSAVFIFQRVRDSSMFMLPNHAACSNQNDSCALPTFEIALAFVRLDHVA